MGGPGRRKAHSASKAYSYEGEKGWEGSEVAVHADLG